MLWKKRKALRNSILLLHYYIFLFELIGPETWRLIFSRVYTLESRFFFFELEAELIMEDARMANLVESKLFFQPHHRSHFRSESYRTLVRIVSSLCKNADVSSAMDFDPQQLRAAYSNHLRQATVESSGQQVGEDFIRPEIGDSANEKVTVVEDGLEMNSLEDGCFHDSEVQMNVVEDTAIVGRSDNASNEREFPAVSSHDNHCVHEESHRNKSNAEHMVEGNKVLVDFTSSNKMRTLDQTNCGNDQLSPKKLQEKIIGHQKVMAEEDAMDTVQELFVTKFSLDGEKIREASKHKKDNQEKMRLIVDKDVHQWTENRPKESKPEGIVCEPDLEIERSHVSSFEVMEVEHGGQRSGKVFAAELSYLDKEVPCRSYEQSNNSKDGPILKKVDTSKVEKKIPSEDIQMDKCLIENEDIEEGEIFGDSTYDISEDPAVLDEKVVDIQISEGTMNRNKLSSIKANGEAKNPDSLFSDMVTSLIEDQNDFMLEPEEAGYTVKDSEPKKDVDSFTACISNQVLHGNVLNERATGQKEIVSAEKENGAINKKKRGPLSEGRKEKKKVQKRKKRASVKRLKLPPVTVPKPVVYCRHYIKGRCQQGDKCKFSHDTTPVTKSIPCSYFARHSCMKGNDCPFDHRLFKYPCTTFVSMGYCPRGDTCMFSHKILPQEQSSTLNLKTELKPPLVPDSLDSQKKSNISGDIKQKFVTVPNYAGASCNRTPQRRSLPTRRTGSPPIGISFLSFGKSPDHSSQVKNDDVECTSLLARSALCLVESSNENSRKIQSETTPKRMSFLSFGRTSLKFNSEKLAAPSSYNDATIPSSYQIQAVSETGQGSSELLKKVQMTTPKPTNFSSPIGNYTSNELLNSSSNSKPGSDLSVPVKGSMNDKPEGLSAIYSRFPCNSFSPGQSSDSSASSMNKGTPNSAQNALLSTLAFAAKYELMNKGKSIDSAGSEGNKEDRNENINGSLKNDQTKASKLLDFLLGVESKSNLK